MSHPAQIGGYAIVGVLKEGTMAEVFQGRAQPGLAKSPGEPDDVVLKRLVKKYRNDAAWVRQFSDEAKLLLKLRHPNIAHTYRVEKMEGDDVIVQELVTGRTLGFMRAAFAEAAQPMPMPAAIYVARSILNALEYLHQSRLSETGAPLIHGDVQADNVLLSVRGEVKLCDFGAAQLEGSLALRDIAFGLDPSSMSPEVANGEAVDRRADVYSVGVLLWELCANARLFAAAKDSETQERARLARVPLLSTKIPDAPGLLVRVLRKALLADRDLRFQTALEFGEALDAVCDRENWPTGKEAILPLLDAA